jgi:hypothetical protein
LTDTRQEAPPTPRILRQFAQVLAGGVTILFFVLPAWRHGEFRIWPPALAFLVLAVGFLRPLWLAVPYRAWMRFGLAMGWINSRVILGILFFGVLTPTALVLKLMGKDLLQLRIDPRAGSYRKPSKSRPSADMEQPF